MLDSVWARTLDAEAREILEASDGRPASTDVAVIGAGLIGLSAAYYLVESGVRSVAVIDRGGAIGEASGANAGGLWFAQQALELGPVARLALESSRLYAELIERFDVDYRRNGLLELIHDEAALRDAKQRLEGMRRAGFRGELTDGPEARRLEPALGFQPLAALHLPGEANLHPAKLAAAFVRRIRAAGGKVCGGVEALRPGPPVETSQGHVAAGAVVIACGAWTPILTGVLGWKPPIRPIRGALLSLGSQPQGTLRHTVLGERYYYWQLAAGPVAGGGSLEDVGFERGLAEGVVEDIQRDLARHFPALASEPVDCAWSGFRPFCEDSKPVIGPAPGRSGVFVAAGHFRKGVMLAPVTGRILADLVTTGRTDLEISPLRPDRFALEQV